MVAAHISQPIQHPLKISYKLHYYDDIHILISHINLFYFVKLLIKSVKQKAIVRFTADKMGVRNMILPAELDGCNY